MFLLQVLNEEVIGGGFQFLDKLSPKFFVRLAFNLATAIILIRYIFIPNNRSKDRVFTFLTFNLVIFLITFLLNKVEMSMGAAFGLFAVFSMLRYRTDDITTKEMTYMFLFIAIGLINAIGKGNWDELTLINLLIIGFTYVLESNIIYKKEVAKIVMYDNVEKVKPELRKELIADLENKLGVTINHIIIGKVDFVRDIAQVHVYYYE